MQPRLFSAFFTILCMLSPGASTRAGGPAAAKQAYFSIRIYQLKNAQQEERVDKFLKEAFIPALHRQASPG